MSAVRKRAPSARQDGRSFAARVKLAGYVRSGRLRQDLERRGVELEVVDLLVGLAAGYCSPRRRRP